MTHQKCTTQIQKECDEGPGKNCPPGRASGPSDIDGAANDDRSPPEPTPVEAPVAPVPIRVASVYAGKLGRGYSAFLFRYLVRSGRAEACTYCFRETKGDKPQDGHDEVDGKREERVSKRRKEDYGKKGAEGRDDGGIDEARVRVDVCVADKPEEISHYSQNDDGRDELSDAEAHAQDFGSRTHGDETVTASRCGCP